MLGLSEKATAARLAIGRSLYDGGTTVEAAKEAIDSLERGSAIEGVHLFGDDSDAWACAIAVSVGTPITDATQFRILVEFHWHRGAKLLEKDLSDVHGGPIDFLVQLAGRIATSSGLSGTGPDRDRTALRLVSTLVGIQILRDSPSWAINAAGGNGLIVISGRPGSGKSQLALDMLAQAAAQGVRFLFFDLKGELEEADGDNRQQEKRQRFLEATGADYIKLIDSSLPINPLLVGNTPAETAQIASEVAHLARCFASQLGANQERLIRDAYQELAVPDIDSLVQAMADRGDEGVGISILDKIRSFRVFSSTAEAVDVDEWLTQSRIIDFKGLGNDTETKSLIVAFVLNTIMRRLSRQIPVSEGVQPLQMILFVDEAHLLLPKEGKAGLLGSLARQGRSWGFPVWLASQDADAFVTRGQHAVDFAELADCGIHLSPGTLTDAQQRQILGQVMHRTLKTGEGVVRLRAGAPIVGVIRQFHIDNGQVVTPSDAQTA
jgi:hypothetical protein